MPAMLEGAKLVAREPGACRYATDNEEFHAGLACVAVPVADGGKRVCAAGEVAATFAD
jgi:DNA-binding IclR family transcriptional regulator